MPTNEQMISEINEIRSLIKINDYSADQIKKKLLRIETAINSRAIFNVNICSNMTKSFLITFNINNYADFTAVFFNFSDHLQIIEYAGSELIFHEFENLIKTDLRFYKDNDSIIINGNKYRIFFESMENKNGIYTIITLTESVFFKPGKFHMLGDFIMEIIRSSDFSCDSVFNDFFEDTIIGINKYIMSSNPEEIDFFLLKFENIDEFFLKKDLEGFAELSVIIKNKLSEIAGDKASMFRISLTEYVVIIKNNFFRENSTLDFIYKGIVLQFRITKIPGGTDHSLYSIFESIGMIQNS